MQTQKPTGVSWNPIPESNQLIPLGYKPEQQNMIGNLGQMGMAGLNQPYQAPADLPRSAPYPRMTPMGFAPIAAQTQQNFNEVTIPQLMHRLSNLGMGNSSGFNMAAAQAGRGLNADILAQNAQWDQNQQRTNQGQQALDQQQNQFEQSLNQQNQHFWPQQYLNQQRNYMDMTNAGLTRQFENLYTEMDPGMKEKLKAGLLTNFGENAPGIISGGLSAVSGFLPPPFNFIASGLGGAIKAFTQGKKTA